MHFALRPTARTASSGEAPNPVFAWEDGKITTTQQMDRESGFPLWTVTVAVLDAGQAPDGLKIKIPAADPAQLVFDAFEPVRIVDLDLGIYNGRITARAAGIESAL